MKLASSPAPSQPARSANPELQTDYAAFVDHFNRRDWDGVRELISADARLTVADRLPENLGRLLISSIRPLALAWKLAVANWMVNRLCHSSTRSGHLDRLLSNLYECDRPQDERIADYIHCPWMITAAASASTAART